MNITQAAIIEAAIQILNEHGLDRLSMREIAKRLDIKAASLYWHVQNKDELLALIAEHISSTLPIDDAITDPRDHLESVLLAYRSSLMEVRDAVQIFHQTPPTTPARRELITAMLGKLEGIGVQARDLITTANLLNNYVLAFVADELTWKRVLPADPILFGHPFDMDFDRHFQHGLRVLLNGIETTLQPADSA